MSHAKNQHYVSRLYLRQFAFEAGKNPHIYAFDKPMRRVIRPSIKNIAAALHFYESSDTGIERLLGRAEGEFVPSYRLLREADSIDAIGADDRIVVSLFLAVQLIRTVEFREQLKSITAQIDEWSKLHGHNLDPSYTTITEEQCREIQVSSIKTMVPDLAGTISALKWVRLHNRTPMPFWTSDNPINFYNPRPSDVRGNLGLKCRGIQVFFPLSPTLALCLCDPIDYGAFPSDGVADNVQNIMFQNDLQLRRSTRFVFSQSNDFSLANEVLDDYPEIAEAERPRFRSGNDVS